MQPKYFCPDCGATFSADQQFCGQCGADMQRASRLDLAARVEADTHSIVRSADPLGETEGLDTDDERRAYGDAWLGRVIDGRYRVDEILGHGGMGVVYKVEHLRMGKIAAMKVVHHDLAGDQRVVSRFQREAEAVSRLTHPNTVQVFDFGTEDDALYLIMEYVRGTNLGELVSGDGPMKFVRAAPIFAQICSALAEAHDIGVVHRDLKPDNILVTRTHAGRDFAKVLDFGLAKFGREDRQDVTEKGSIVGTPYFMSPEQIRGEPVDSRSDVYSLGALMYKVLTGEYLFTAKSPVGILTKHLTEEVVPPSKRVSGRVLPTQVDRIVMKCVAKNSDERYASVTEIMDELERAYVEALNASQETSSASLFSGFGVSASGHLRRGDEGDVDYGIRSDLRLRRADIDVYEKKIKRKFWLRVALVPVVLALVAAAGIYFALLYEKPLPTHEIENNNEFSSATEISGDKPVQGFLGKRRDISQADRDFFRLRRPLKFGESLTVHVSCPPNMDIVVALYDGTEHLIARRDTAGIGQSEWIRRQRMRGAAVIAVEQAKTGPFPIENISDAYVLSVEYHRADPTLESEPNDELGEALPVEVGQAIEGHFDRGDDVDRFRFEGPDGEYSVELRGLPKTAWSWQVGSGVRQTASARTRLRGGDVITLRSELSGKSARSFDLSYQLLLRK